MGKKVIRSIVLAVIIAGTIVMGVGCAIALPALDPSKLEMPDNVTKIYSIDPKESPIEIRPDKGEPVQYDMLKPYVKLAIISTEDRQFYDHNGINYRSIARAIYKDIIAGGKVEGGSTITQQLAKNTFLSHEKTFTRKIKEIALAAQIEREYTKEDILEMYMNKVNFHPSAIGIEAAAKIYFNKSADKLDLAEAAFLAGLPQAPSYYYNNLDAALKRREIVLQNMVRDGYISEQQAKEAAKKPVSKDYVKNDPSKFRFPHYVEYILDEAERKYQIPKEQVMRGGLQIYTHLDTKAQQKVEAQFKNDANFPPDAKDGVRVESAIVIVNPKSGGIVAMVGGRDTNSFMNLNRAFQIKRQPGSSIKPLVVYGPAIDSNPNKYNPNTMLNDKKGTAYPGNPPFAPRDWDDHKRIKRGDEVSMRLALQWSLNIPAVDLLSRIDVKTGKSFAEKAGIPFDKNDNGLGIALGGMDAGVSPLNMADAYQAFDNKGVRTEAHAIKKITTSSGTILAQAKTSPTQVMKESTANTITSLLQVVVNEGTGTLAKIPGRQVAGKTGTTEFENGGNRDSWFVGYSPELVAAVWMGFDKTDRDHNLKDDYQTGRFASGYPAQLFSRVMSEVLKGYPASSFPAPVEEKKKDETQAIQLSGEWTGKTIMLKWSPLKGDAQYFVFRTENLDQTEGGPPIGMTKEAIFVDTDVQPGKSYYYVVSAVDLSDQRKELGQSNVLLIKTTNEKDKDKEKPKDTTQPPTPGSGGTGTGSTPSGTSGGTGGTSGGTSGGTGGTSGGTGGITGGSSGGTSGGTTPNPSTNGTSQ